MSASEMNTQLWLLLGYLTLSLSLFNGPFWLDQIVFLPFFRPFPEHHTHNYMQIDTTRPTRHNYHTLCQAFPRLFSQNIIKRPRSFQPTTTTTTSTTLLFFLNKKITTLVAPRTFYRPTETTGLLKLVDFFPSLSLFCEPSMAPEKIIKIQGGKK